MSLWVSSKCHFINDIESSNYEINVQVYQSRNKISNFATIQIRPWNCVEDFLHQELCTFHIDFRALRLFMIIFIITIFIGNSKYVPESILNQSNVNKEFHVTPRIFTYIPFMYSECFGLVVSFSHVLSARWQNFMWSMSI